MRAFTQKAFRDLLSMLMVKFGIDDSNIDEVAKYEEENKEQSIMMLVENKFQDINDELMDNGSDKEAEEERKGGEKKEQV